MFSFLSRLFTTADGSVPIIQIIAGMVLGAIAMFAYAKICKPKYLYEDLSLFGRSAAPASQIPYPPPQVPVSQQVAQPTAPAKQPTMMRKPVAVPDMSWFAQQVPTYIEDPDDPDEYEEDEPDQAEDDEDVDEDKNGVSV